MRDDDVLQLEIEHAHWRRTASRSARAVALAGLLLTLPLWTYPLYLALASVTSATWMPDTPPELEVWAGLVVLVGGPISAAAAVPAPAARRHFI